MTRKFTLKIAVLLLAEIVRVVIVRLWPVGRTLGRVFVGMFSLLFLLSLFTGTETNALLYFVLGTAALCVAEILVRRLSRVRFFDF